MTKQQQERAETLLKAAQQIFNKCSKSTYIIDALSCTAFYDDADCDGECLREDINDFLFEINKQK